MDRLNEAIRLISDSRRPVPVDARHCVDLMKEFLRRESLWARELCLTHEIPFADLADAGSGIRSSENYCETIKSFAYSAAENRCCSAMLNWYAWKDSSPGIHGDQRLPDPYLPLLHFFRLGGTFTREHRVFIDVNGEQMIQADTIQNGDLTRVFVPLEE